MSTYLNPRRNFAFDAMSTTDLPDYARQFLIYLDSTCNLAHRTRCSYYIQLRQFLRWILVRGQPFNDEIFHSISPTNVSIEEVAKITESDIEEYLSFCHTNLGNSPTTRAQKRAALKRFYQYMVLRKYIPENPTNDIPLPRLEKRLPKYLTLQESLHLLRTEDTEFPERGKCILFLLLNCGMRLSELAALNLSSIHDDTLLIYGKGRKERVVYLNEPCTAALYDYLAARQTLPKIIDKDALFLSKRTGKRITARRIEQIVEKCLQQAGLDGRGISPHKLRHTAATLMYQSNAGLLEIKEILGHESTSTTEIYTHLNEEQLRKVARESILAKVLCGTAPVASSAKPG